MLDAAALREPLSKNGRTGRPARGHRNLLAVMGPADEPLNETLFFDLNEARTKICACMADYNLERPHALVLLPGATPPKNGLTSRRLRRSFSSRNLRPTPPKVISPLGKAVRQETTAARA